MATTLRGSVSDAQLPPPDGARPDPVAPSPALLERIKATEKRLRTRGTPASALVRFRQPQRLGLNDGTILPPRDFPLGTSPQRIRGAAAARAPLRGKVRVIAVLVEFPDKKMTRTKKEFQDLFFSEGKLPNGSVKEYYHEVTDGLIDIVGEVVGPYKLPKKLVAYAHGESGMGDTQPNAQAMARDAAVLADKDVDFGPYDNDGNGYVDAFIVIHAGSGAEETGLGTDIWSHKWTLAGSEYKADATKIFGYLTVPEDCKIGVCSHELGHLLFGWPDLYDIDNSSSGLGEWCLMAGGSWNGTGDIPAHPSAWCKADQGWVTVVNEKAAKTITIQDIHTGKEAHRLWKGGAASPEYFLLENRQKSGYDRELPGDGLLVYHIDDSVDTNADETHYKVGLLQADGLQELESGTNQGDDGDPYPGSAGITELTGATVPNTHSYSGLDTSVTVRQVKRSNGTITAKITVAGSTPPANDPLLKQGSKGPDVVRLQQALLNLGFDPGPIDGDFGPKTVKAVKAYQKARGLTADGIVGPKTWAALHADGQ